MSEAARPGPVVYICEKPGCGAYACCGLAGRWYCSAHVPDDFWALTARGRELAARKAQQAETPAPPAPPRQGQLI
jgi:hypothetical protein